MKAGMVYSTPMEPAESENTILFAAGDVVFGLEYRTVSEESLRKSFAEMGELDSLEREVQPGFEGEGFSVHVFGSDEHEYLRFDCFDGDPHYHYNHARAPGAPVHNHWVPFDDVACGPMWDWTLNCLRTRLRQMLVEAGGSHVAASLNDDLVADALGQMEAAARQPRDHAALGRPEHDR
jgi:hypothetical protein